MPRISAAASRLRPAYQRSLISSALAGTQAVQRLIQSLQPLLPCRSSDGVEFQIHPFPLPAPLQPSLPPDIFDQDAAHGLGGGREEMPAAGEELITGC
jgi:hypothetical protein